MKKIYLLSILFFICSCCCHKNYDITPIQKENNDNINNIKLISEPILKVNCNFNKKDDQNKIYFNFNDYKLTTQAKNKLTPIANWLVKNSEIKVFIEGHTDEKGTEEYNLLLGKKRAESVESYLITKGVDKSRINIISYGKEKPEFINVDEKESAKNRRVIINIYEE